MDGRPPDKPDELRTCSVCGEAKPNTAENYLRYYDKRDAKWYVKHLCRACAAKKAREWRMEKNPDRYHEYAKERIDSGKAKAYSDRWKVENRERYLESRRLWRQRPENKVKTREYNQRRRDEPGFREKQRAWNASWKSRNADHVKAYQREWADAHRGYFVTKANERRTAMAALPSTLTEPEWERALAWFGNGCAYCGTTGVRLNREHVVPVKHGGGYTAANIIPACGRCNSSKGAHDMDSWFRRQPFFSEQRLRRITDYLNKED